MPYSYIREQGTEEHEKFKVLSGYSGDTHISIDAEALESWEEGMLWTEGRM